MPGKTTWTQWGEQATKGDVVMALVATRSCIIDIYVCLSALNRNDMDKFKESLADLHGNDEQLRELIESIGGMTPEDG
jgi:hypothetical protein